MRIYVPRCIGRQISDLLNEKLAVYRRVCEKLWLCRVCSGLTRLRSKRGQTKQMGSDENSGKPSVRSVRRDNEILLGSLLRSLRGEHGEMQGGQWLQLTLLR